jgi:hypothetical protein
VTAVKPIRKLLHLTRRALWALPFVLVFTACAPRETAIGLAFPGRDPGLTWDREGRLHAVWVEDRDGVARVVYRRLHPSPSATVVLSAPGASASAHGETPPWIAALPGGTLFAAYTVALPGKWQSEIRTQRSTDGGATWSEPAMLAVGGDRGSHNELAAGVAVNGEIFLAWLDQRDGSRGLRAAKSRDGLQFESEQTLDAVTCECCGNAVAAGPDNEVWIAYRDVTPANLRDLAVVRSRDAGETFESPRPLSADGWTVEGCPHTGARLALGHDGTLWTAWFTGSEPGVYAASSSDGGVTFGPRTRIAAARDDVTGVAHPEIGVLPDGSVAVLYEAVRQGGQRALEARILAPGSTQWGSTVPVATDAAYPRLAVDGTRAVLAYTEREEGRAPRVVVRSWAL